MLNEYGSVSSSEDVFAPLMNPVFNDTPGNSFLGYRYFSFLEKEGGNHYSILRLLGFSFSYAWLNNIYNPDTKKIDPGNASFMNISKGFYINNILGIGGSYAFSRSNNEGYDDYKSWTAGFLLRPFRYVSMGAAVRDMGAKLGPDKIKRNGVYSLSIRPYTEALTLSADAMREDGEKYSGMNYSYSLMLKIPYDINLSLKYDDKKNIFFGLQIPLLYRTESSARNLVLDSNMSRYENRARNFYSAGLSIPMDINKSAVNLPVSNNMLLIRINKSISENEGRKILKDDAVVFFDILSSIRSAAEDSTISGIVLQIDDAGLDFVQVQELRDELKIFRSTGKKVHAILTTIGNVEYYLAAAADKIYFTPNSSFSIQGLSASVYFFKEMLDSAGIKYESIRKGRFKSFNEPFVRQNMSPEFRENMKTLLADLNGQFLGDIASDRKIDKAAVDKILSSGIMTPGEAKAARFIDEVMYAKEAVEDMGENVNLIKLADFLNEDGRHFRWSLFPEIAIVYVNGAIIDGESKGSKYMDSIGDDTFGELMKVLFSDNNIKAIVIRVNSGGGSAAASDNMLNTLMELKNDFNKPVIFSFGNMAASGGYYISCTGDKIFSSRGTVTGSIGVIFGKLTLRDLYKKLGINKEVVKLSEYADIFSESKELNEKERKILQAGIDFMYNRFTDIVMKARNYKIEDIDSVAEGRVFTGSQAKPNRLIDEIGGLAAAVEYAKLKSGIEGDYRIAGYPEREFLINEFFSPLSGTIIDRYAKKFFKNVNIPYGNKSNVLLFFPYKIIIE